MVTISLLLINLLIAAKDTGIIAEAQITIEVTDDEKIDERFWDFLLIAEEVPGYHLKKVYQSDCCLISPDGLGYVVNQDWASIDEDIEINLTMEIFDTEETAIRGMKSYMDTAEPWIKDEGVRMGIRREWQNSQGKVIGVDICKLESNTMAEYTASERKKMWITLFQDQESSRIKVHGRAVIHIYYLNHDYDAIPMISPPDYPPPPPVSSYMNPIYYDRLGLTFIHYNNSYYNLGSYYSRFPTTAYNNISLRYSYNGNLYQPNLSSYVRNSSVPFYMTVGYNYPAYYPERYTFPINPKEPHGGYIFPYRYNPLIYRYSSSNPYPVLTSGIFNLLASSNLNSPKRN